MRTGKVVGAMATLLVPISREMHAPKQYRQPVRRQRQLQDLAPWRGRTYVQRELRSELKSSAERFVCITRRLRCYYCQRHAYSLGRFTYLTNSISNNNAYCRPKILSATSLRTNFLILPLPVRGTSASQSSPSQKMCTGALWRPNIFLTQAFTSSRSGFSVLSSWRRKAAGTST